VLEFLLHSLDYYRRWISRVLKSRGFKKNFEIEYFENELHKDN